MQQLKRLGRYVVNNRRCVLTYARQTSEATLQVHVDSDWAGDLLGRKSTTSVFVRRTFVETHVMFADACYIIERRSALRFDSRSVFELGNSITLPRLDDGCSNLNPQ